MKKFLLISVCLLVLFSSASARVIMGGGITKPVLDPTEGGFQITVPIEGAVSPTLMPHEGEGGGDEGAPVSFGFQPIDGGFYLTQPIIDGGGANGS